MRIGISRFRRALLLTALLPLLAACENSATAFMVEGKEHALILVREQKVFWTDEVKQAVIAAVAPFIPEGVHFIPGHPMAGTEYSIADMAIFPWYGRIATGGAYGDAATFLANYRIAFMVLGITLNAIGITVSLRKLHHVPAHTGDHACMPA